MPARVSAASTLSAQFPLNRNLKGLHEIFLRLAWGRRTNTGKDDPAGLIASERLAAEIRTLEVESRSIQRLDANAEGHAAQLSSLFLALNALAVASANGAGMSDAEIASNQMRIDQTVASIQRFGGDARAARVRTGPHHEFVRDEGLRLQKRW